MLFGAGNLKGLAGHVVPVVAATKILLAVDKHDHVRILFDRARFAQVAEPGTVAFRILRLPVKLGQAQHRHVQFSGKAFESAGDARHLFLPRVFGIVRFNQL